MQVKFCRYCNRHLAASAFTVRRKSPDGLSLKCAECSRAYNKKRYSELAEVQAAAKQRAARWAKANREKRRAIAAAYEAAHRKEKQVRERERHKRKRLENPERERLVGRIATQARRLRSEAAGEKLTLREATLILGMARGRCVYCGATARLTLDHVRPLARSGNHDWSNFIPCCKPCNSSKHTKDAADWLFERHGAVGLANAFIFMKSVRKVARRFGWRSLAVKES